MRRIFLSVVLSLGFSSLGCGGGGGGGDLCSNLAKGSGCDGTAKDNCTTAITQGKSDHPACSNHIDALASCAAGLRLSCTGATSASANGTGDIGGGQNFITVGGFSLVVNDAECDVYRRGLAACQSCPDAIGANDPEVLGIGDKCGGTRSCASGLGCEGGICTRSCAADTECAARADECKLQFQYPNVCGAGKCTRSCGSDVECQIDISESSKCVDGACSL